MLQVILAKLKNEPALIVGALASVLVFVAAQAGVVLDNASLEVVLTPIVTAIVTRFFVSPAKKGKAES